MSRSYEPIVTDSGDVLWPIETLDGWRLLRAIDAQVLTIKESSKEYRALRAAEIFGDDDDVMETV